MKTKHILLTTGILVIAGGIGTYLLSSTHASPFAKTDTDSSQTIETTLTEDSSEQGAIAEDEELLEENEIAFKIFENGFDDLERLSSYPNAKNINANPINESMFDKALANQPDPFMVYDTLQYPKINKRTKLPIDNGTIMVFKDAFPDYDNDGVTIYSYLGYLSNINKYVLGINLWEAYACLLVDKSNGTVSIYSNITLFNKEGTRMLVIDSDPYNESTAFYVYDTSIKPFKMTYTRTLEDYFGIDKSYWVDEGTFDIMYTKGMSNDPETLHYMRLSVE